MNYSDDEFEYLSDQHNRTINEAKERGYKMKYSNVKGVRQPGKLERFFGLLNGVCRLVGLSVLVYGAYKFYKTLDPNKPSSPDDWTKYRWVNKSPEGDRVMDGKIKPWHKFASIHEEMTARGGKAEEVQAFVHD